MEKIVGSGFAAVKRERASRPLRASTANPAFCRAVERIHDLGPRPLAEILVELVGKWGQPFEADLAGRMQRYSKLDAGIVRALGGDRFALLPLHRLK